MKYYKIQNRSQKLSFLFTFQALYVHIDVSTSTLGDSTNTLTVFKKQWRPLQTSNGLSDFLA